MTLTQLEYVVAVDRTRHFAKAAALCHISQPTLSMQLGKLEEELGILLFDRTKQPVVPTASGAAVIAQARAVLSERDRILEIVEGERGLLRGSLHVGVIPTLGPYLLPLVIPRLVKEHPDLHLRVSELTTSRILEGLHNGTLDAGLLVTPLDAPSVKEEPLFYEELVAWVSPAHPAYHKAVLHPKDLEGEGLWLLEEGHCFRSQILNLCAVRKEGTRPVHYEAGSLETLKRLVGVSGGITVLPELATLEGGARAQRQLRYFRSPAPVREVSLVTHRSFVKKRLLEALKAVVLDVLPEKIKKSAASGRRTTVINVNRES